MTDKERARVRALIEHQRAIGIGPSNIAAMLNRDCIRGPRGGYWCTSTVLAFVDPERNAARQRAYRARRRAERGAA